MRAATLKGLVLHTAGECGVDDHDVSIPGPDYRHGWGILDALAAYLHMYVHFNERPHCIQELSIGHNELIRKQYGVTGSELKVTICWTDPPGETAPIALDPPEWECARVS